MIVSNPNPERTGTDPGGAWIRTYILDRAGCHGAVIVDPIFACIWLHKYALFPRYLLTVEAS